MLSMSRQRSANSSPRRSPDRTARPTMVCARAKRFDQCRRLRRCQRPFRPHTLERRQFDAARRILREMSPLHGRAKDRAQHIVNVIDGLGRVTRHLSAACIPTSRRCRVPCASHTVVCAAEEGRPVRDTAPERYRMGAVMSMTLGMDSRRRTVRGTAAAALTEPCTSSLCLTAWTCDSSSPAADVSTTSPCQAAPARGGSPRCTDGASSRVRSGLLEPAARFRVTLDSEISRSSTPRLSQNPQLALTREILTQSATAGLANGAQKAGAPALRHVRVFSSRRGRLCATPARPVPFPSCLRAAPTALRWAPPIDPRDYSSAPGAIPTGS